MRKELSVLEKKCEDLIALAVSEGARANCPCSQTPTDRGPREDFSISEPFLLVQAHLEERYCSSARREGMRRASRRLAHGTVQEGSYRL